MLPKDEDPAIMATKKNKRQFEDHALYFVEWQDAHTTEDRWMPIEDVEEQSKPFICRTVGWVTAQTEITVSLTQTCGRTENSASMYSNTFVIPRGWITTIKKLS